MGGNCAAAVLEWFEWETVAWAGTDISRAFVLAPGRFSGMVKGAGGWQQPRPGPVDCGDVS